MNGLATAAGRRRGAAALLAIAAAATSAGWRGALVVVASGAAIVVLWPLLVRYALARPNARSSHREPTPQGGGIAVVGATLAGLWLWGSPAPALTSFAAAIVCGALALAVAGAIDDVRPLPVAPRLIVQALAVGAVIALAPAEWRLAPALPMVLERLLLVVAGIWLVNLTNFVDGIDGITAAHLLPLALGVAVLAGLGFASPWSGALATALAAALLGFLPFNLPPARLFLGDVGSLPLGLIAGALLLDVAAQGSPAAAILLAAYPFVDATLTLFDRIRRRVRLADAHREHFYQRAVDRGRPVIVVAATVAILQLVLAGLAIACVLTDVPALRWALVGAGLILITLVLGWFSGRLGRR